MPHFVIDCSENIIKKKTPDEIMQVVFDAAVSTELFSSGDIKVRINPYKYFMVANTQDDFIHVFAHIMGGRNNDQKKDLSKEMITTLKAMFPDVPVISINITDFDKETYCNKPMV